MLPFVIGASSPIATAEDSLKYNQTLSNVELFFDEKKE